METENLMSNSEKKNCFSIMVIVFNLVLQQWKAFEKCIFSCENENETI